MKGYKATYNYKCIDQHYAIGQTYELEGDLIMCVNGFHFCLNMSDVLNYKDSYGYEEWKEYDEKGKLIHYKSSC